MRKLSWLWLASLAIVTACTFDPKELSTPGVKPDGSADVTSDHGAGGSDLVAGRVDSFGPEAPVVQADGNSLFDVGREDRFSSVDSGKLDRSAFSDGSQPDGMSVVDGTGLDVGRTTADVAAANMDTPTDRAVPSSDLPPRTPDASPDIRTNLPLGNSCSSGTQCSSGICTDGTCCVSSCTGGCNVGCGSNGQCRTCTTCTCSGDTGICHC